MADTKVCDRCGKVIPFLSKELLTEKEAWRYEIRKDCHPYPDVITIDLCMDCKRDLMRWLGKKVDNG